ncbi:MAG: protein kinase domain-containing protein [Chromatiales bacterium]
MANPAPKKLGKYEVLREISRGSMGTVYLGHDPYLDRQVAIKVAHAEQLNDEHSGAQYRKMFFNEAHTAGLLTHPNIVAILDAGVEEQCYIVMEYVEGGTTLKPCCKPDALLPIEKVVEIVFKCAKALDYAHRQGIIHRDIKPSNILLTPDLDVKIGDFSIAYITKLDATGTMPLGLVGSPLYLSPEQINEDALTAQTDIFSLGIIMFELLTGRHPFAAESFSRLIQRILNDEPPPIDALRRDLPKKLDRIMRTALAKNQAQRYLTALDLAADLSRAFEHLLEQPREDLAVKELFTTIRKLEFFQTFPDSELWQLVRAGTWLQFEPGREIIVEGEIDDSFYVIAGGAVTVRKGGRDLRMLARGDCFGEMGYLTRTRRTATIVACEPTSLLKLNSTVINQLSMSCQVHFLKVFVRTLIQRLSVTTERESQQGEKADATHAASTG